ncbi:MAG: DUF2089 domain-containing protein [Clostridiales bacterium]|nr:DUF2089 domain-containing protein [Clostridiales bacterium]
MINNIISICAVCGNKLEVTELHCHKCDTRYQGHFHMDKFSYLSPEQKFFIEVFLKCRGNIKEVEKELDISYPTVRSKLDDVISSLGYKVTANEKSEINKKEILEMLNKGEITYDEALKLLKDCNK